MSRAVAVGNHRWIPRPRIAGPLLVFAAFLSARLAFGAVPTLEHLYPAGAGPGSTSIVSVHGTYAPWPVHADIEGAGVRFQASTNAGKFEVVVAPDAPPGPRWVRLFNGDGASEPRLFVVGDGPELADQEPNDSWSAAQVVPRLPATINGRLDRTGDVDSFAVSLAAGQWLEARVDAFTLMSGLDAVLRVATTNGLSLAWNHDFITFDPRVVWRAPSNQTVVVQVFGFRYPADSSVVLAGGEAAVYRLHLAASSSFPDPRPAGPKEIEPNDRGTNAVALPADGVVVGTIDKPGDEDRFRFEVTGGEWLSLTVEAAILGSPLDAWLRIEEREGKELAFSDDAESSRDPHLDWKAPRSGEFVAAVGSLTHRGDADQYYRLVVKKGVPGIRGRALSGGMVLEPGTTNEFKVAVTRQFGFTNAVQVVPRGLPKGVSAAEVAAPPADGEVTLRLVAAPESEPFQGPFRIVLVDGVTREERGVDYELISRGENNGVPQGWWRLLRERTARLWLTVKPKPAPEKK